MTPRSRWNARVAMALLCSTVALALVLALCRASIETVHAQRSFPDFRWNKPLWAPTPVVPLDNPMSDAKIALGRRLFYDKRLSADGSMSCASCHKQSRAFTDGQPTHLGVTGVPGIRNAMTLANVAYFSSYTWANPSLSSLERQMEIPLFSDHPIEMGMMGHDDKLVAELTADQRYKDAFESAFPDDAKAVTVRNITRAIAAFERVLLSFNSPYDRYKHGENRAISPSAKRGEALFFGEKLECYHCHGGTNFTDNNTQVGQAIPEVGFHNTGLYNEDGLGSYKKWDHGLRDVTGKEDDEGAFRTPTLRNVAVTAPYMHDGSIKTLEDVIRKHYAIKGQAAASKNGASPLRSEFIEGFSINDQEVKDLVAFLRALTDQDFLQNPAFSDPSNRTDASSLRRKRVHGE